MKRRTVYNLISLKHNNYEKKHSIEFFSSSLTSMDMQSKLLQDSLKLIEVRHFAMLKPMNSHS